MKAQCVSVGTIALLVALTAATGCGSKGTTVDRIDPATVTDVPGQYGTTPTRGSWPKK